MHPNVRGVIQTGEQQRSVGMRQAGSIIADSACLQLLLERAEPAGRRPRHLLQLVLLLPLLHGLDRCKLVARERVFRPSDICFEPGIKIHVCVLCHYSIF